MDKAERTESTPTEYEPPKLVDYGSLLELTRSAHSTNRDINGGPNDTAFSAGP